MAASLVRYLGSRFRDVYIPIAVKNYGTSVAEGVSFFPTFFASIVICDSITGLLFAHIGSMSRSLPEILNGRAPMPPSYYVAVGVGTFVLVVLLICLGRWAQHNLLMAPKPDEDAVVQEENRMKRSKVHRRHRIAASDVHVVVR